MATSRQISDIKEMASEGESVNMIKDELNLPKSTVYYHFKKVVGQKQKRNALEVPEDEDFIGELCGIFAGDGSHYFDEKKGSHDILFHLNQKEDYWRILADYMEEKLQKKPFIHHTNDSKTILKYISKPLHLALKDKLYWEDDKSYTVTLRDKDFSTEFKKGFIRGLIDTDGYMNSKEKYYNYTTISKDLAKKNQYLINLT
jgi:predicted transcriptional regulator